MKQIGKNIKKYRMEKGMTQDQLAEKLNVTRQAVSNWETGKTRPNLETLAAIGEHFGISVEDLIYGSAGRLDAAAGNAAGIGLTFGASFLLYMMFLILTAGVLFSNIWWIMITVSLTMAGLTTAVYKLSEKLEMLTLRLEALERNAR